MTNTLRNMMFVLAVGVLGAGLANAQPRLSIPAEESAPPPGVTLEEHQTYYAPDIDTVMPIQVYTEGMPVPLYERVVYRGTRKVCPDYVPYLVEVPLPQPKRGCVSCEPCFALVKICVPPCKVPCVRVRRDGYTLLYDFGESVVKVAVRRDGRVIVNYKS